MEEQYWGSLDFASPEAIRAVSEIPLRLFRATWSGTMDDVKALVVPEFRWTDARPDTAFNPFYVSLDAPQDYLMWKFADGRDRRQGEHNPEVGLP